PSDNVCRARWASTLVGVTVLAEHSVGRAPAAAWPAAMNEREDGMTDPRDPSSFHAHKLTHQLASFCLTTRAENLPAAALDSARQLILDTIGVALLASTHKVGRLISAQVAELGGSARTASVFGAGNLKVAPVFAAQANGTMANALDYD